MEGWRERGGGGGEDGGGEQSVDRGLKQVKYMCQVQNFIYEIQLV